MARREMTVGRFTEINGSSSLGGRISETLVEIFLDGEKRVGGDPSKKNHIYGLRDQVVFSSEHTLQPENSSWDIPNSTDLPRHSIAHL